MASLFQSRVFSNNFGDRAESSAGADPRSLHEDDGENTDQACESAVYGSCNEKLENRSKRRQCRKSSRSSKRQKTPTRTLIQHLQNLVDGIVETGKAEVALADELDGLRGAVFALQNSLPSSAEMTLLENSNPLHEKDVADMWQICCKCWEKSADTLRESEQEGEMSSLEQIANLIDQVPRDEKAAAQRCAFFLKMGRFHAELNDFENSETCLSKARRNAVGLEEIVSEWSMPEKQQTEYLTLLFEIFEESTSAAWKSERKALACNTLSRLKGWAGDARVKTSTAGWMSLKLAKLLLKQGHHCLPSECIAFLTDAYEFLKKIQTKDSKAIDIEDVKETETQSLFTLQKIDEGKTVMLEVFDHKDTTGRDFMNCLRLLVEVCGDEKIVKEAALYAIKKSQGKEAQIITDIVTMLFDPSPDTKGSLKAEKCELLERVALEIVGDEFVLSCIMQIEVSAWRKSIFELLWHRGSSKFFSKTFSEARSVLSAALMYSPSETKSKTARLLSLSNTYMGDFEKAEDYAHMAEIGDPKSVLTAMVRLKMLLAKSEEDAASIEIDGLPGCQDFHYTYLETAYEEVVAHQYPKLAKQAVLLLRSICEKDASQSDLAAPASVTFQKTISAMLASNGINNSQKKIGKNFKGNKALTKEIATEIRLVLKRLHAVGKDAFFGKDSVVFQKRVCWFGDICTRLGHFALFEKDWENALVLTQGAIRFYSLLEPKTSKGYLQKKKVCFEATICCLLKIHNANPTKEALLAMAKKMISQLRQEFELLCRMQDSKGAEQIAKTILKISEKGKSPISFARMAQSCTHLQVQNESIQRICCKISKKGSVDYSSKVAMSSVLSAKDDQSKIDAMKRVIQNANTCSSTMDLSPLAAMADIRARVLTKRGLMALANEYFSVAERITSLDTTASCEILHKLSQQGQDGQSGKTMSQISTRAGQPGASTGKGEVEKVEEGGFSCDKSGSNRVRLVEPGNTMQEEGLVTMSQVETGNLKRQGLVNEIDLDLSRLHTPNARSGVESRDESENIDASLEGKNRVCSVGSKCKRESSATDGDVVESRGNSSARKEGSEGSGESLSENRVTYGCTSNQEVEGKCEKELEPRQCGGSDTTGTLEKSMEKNLDVVEILKNRPLTAADGMISALLGSCRRKMELEEDIVLHDTSSLAVSAQKEFSQKNVLHRFDSIRSQDLDELSISSMGD
ncbi:hypothetical protein BSKO_05564 [Bryopsis sp. KO-2023]|nr:hypothetical protein BSKO_05564 [Bryopsis sp. KO-2023]